MPMDRNPLRFAAFPNVRNAETPDRQLAYALDVSPPWPRGGKLTINLPEHLEYMPNTQGILRHNDKNPNGHWQVPSDGQRAVLDVESPTMGRVFVKGEARALSENRLEITMAIANKGDTLLGSIRPLYCFHYAHLEGFPSSCRGREELFDNFDFIHVVADEKAVPLSGLVVEKPEIPRRSATVRGCPQDDYSSFRFTKGGLIEAGIGRALVAVSSRDRKRHIVFGWTPGKSLLSNCVIPCLHADPFYGNIRPGQTKTAKCAFIFTEGPLEGVMKELMHEGIGAPPVLE